MFADRLVQLANRYPNVEYWEVWNEMNLPAMWMPGYNASLYNTLFQACVSAFANAGINNKLAVGYYYHFYITL